MSRVGETIAGKYRIIAPIGVGGMGAVYAARHLQLDTPLALKFLSEPAKGGVERFLREAKACAALKSEHICRVSDFGIDGDTPYIAMELLEGEDLASVLRGGKLEIATAVDYVVQACIGIAEAHALGIVHRDLKPGNLFLTVRPDGSPLIKVLDFGVAKVPIFNNVSLTQTASVIGSPAYMSPEQVRSSRSVDARSDVWALGVILYELVSDRHPFKGESLTDLAVAIAMDPPRPLTEAPELQPLIARCLEKDPGRRYPDVASFAGALARFSGKHADAPDVASRILYGTLERPTIPRNTPRPSGMMTVDDSPATLEDPQTRPEEPGDTRSTTLQRSTGELTARPRSRWGLSLGIAAGLSTLGIGAFVVLQGSSTPTSFEAPPTPPAIPVTPPPPPAPAPPTPEPAKSGRVIVTVSGATDGAIAIDEVERGRGVRVEEELSLGAHEIVLRVPDRDPIRQSVEVQAGMISTVTIVVPAIPTARPVVAIKKAAKKPIAAPGFGKEYLEPKDLEPAAPTTEGSAAPVASEELPSFARPTCPLHERLPSGGCPTEYQRLPTTLDSAAIKDGMRAIWASVLECRGEPDAQTKRFVMWVRVNPDGTIGRISALEAPDAAAGQCIVRAIQRARFKVTREGAVFNYPVDL